MSSVANPCSHLLIAVVVLFTFQEFFHPEELMQMVVGCQDYDFRELEQVTKPINVKYYVLGTRSYGMEFQSSPPRPPRALPLLAPSPPFPRTSLASSSPCPPHPLALLAPSHPLPLAPFAPQPHFPPRPPCPSPPSPLRLLNSRLCQLVEEQLCYVFFFRLQSTRETTTSTTPLSETSGKCFLTSRLT